MERYIAVIGPGDTASSSDCADARTVGRLVAERGAVVVTGGLNGVMDAAAAGAREAGGTVVGLLPGRDRRAGSAHATVTVPTGLGELRNGLVVRSADAVIAVGGSWGTLSEVALARRAGVPLVCLRGWSVVDASGRPVVLDEAPSPAAAVDRAFSLLAGDVER